MIWCSRLGAGHMKAPARWLGWCSSTHSVGVAVEEEDVLQGEKEKFVSESESASGSILTRIPRAARRWRGAARLLQHLWLPRFGVSGQGESVARASRNRKRTVKSGRVAVGVTSLVATTVVLGRPLLGTFLGNGR